MLGMFGDALPAACREQWSVKFNGCKHMRSLHEKKPAGYRTKRKSKIKAQRAARRVSK